MPNGITQNCEAIPVLGLTDLTPRKACGQYLLRCRLLLLKRPVPGDKYHHSDDSGDN